MAEPRRARNAGRADGWRRKEFGDVGELRVFAQKMREVFPQLDMNHDVEWIAEAHGWPNHEVLTLADNDGERTRGVSSFLFSRAKLVYALGPFVLMQPAVNQLKLYQDITSDRSDRFAAIGACFEALFECMPEGSIVYAGAVPIGSDLHRQLVGSGSPLRRRFRVLPWGGESQHCRIRWEGNLERYFASISATSRKDLRRTDRALFADPALKCDVRRFQSTKEVEVFLRDGIDISDKTYQKRDLGLGISWGGAVERMIRFAAERDAFLGYILYIDDVPAAFTYGFVLGKTATMKQTGYDPVWASRQVGSVVFVEALRDIERTKLAVDYLDFMPDMTLFKLRTSNDRRAIRHYYLFKRSPLGGAQYWSLAAIDFLSRSLGRIARRLKRGKPSEIEKYLAR